MSPARPTRLRRALIAVAMVFAALIGALGLQAPAWAASCASGSLCHWSNTVYTGTRMDQYNRNGGVCVNYPSWFNDQETSTWNATGGGIILRVDGGCSNLGYQMGNGSRIPNWVSVCWWCNDEWSSAYFY